MMTADAPVLRRSKPRKGWMNWNSSEGFGARRWTAIERKSRGCWGSPGIPPPPPETVPVNDGRTKMYLAMDRSSPDNWAGSADSLSSAGIPTHQDTRRCITRLARVMPTSWPI